MVAILHRELRIASRRKWTFLGRVLTSGLAFVFGLFLILAGSSRRSNADGSGLFSTLVFLSFWFCLIQGVRRASSSISDEKRDGTLGLLFLTDLKPRDIVFAKLSASAIPLIQPLLSFVPVLAISLLLGGITGGEVGRAFLVLATILGYSISVGLLFSSVSRASETASHGTLVFLLFAVIAPAILSRIHPALASVNLFTPLTAYSTIPDPGYRVSASDFWSSLLITNLLSITFIFLSAYFLPRRWEARQIIAQKTKATNPARHRRFAERRAAILDRNPGEWLAVRHSIGKVEGTFFTIFTLALATVAPVVVSASRDVSSGMGVLSVAALILTIRLASQSSYPLSEARRSGAIEMLGTTPLHPRCLITGQIASLRNQFLPLLGLLLISSVFCVTYEGVRISTVGYFGMLGIFWAIISLLMVTVAALGMWLGLREKSPNIAFFKTILFTLILPLPLLCFAVIVPLYHVIVLVIACAQLSGRDLERLVRGEKRPIEYTPVEPIVAAPPIIRQ